VEGWAEKLGMEVVFAQSNHEGEIVDIIHDADVDAIVLNPGALTHTSHSIGDALAAVGIPAVEVHISNIREREPWRAISLVGPSCVRSIYGRGIGGYQDALRHLKNRSEAPFQTRSYGPHPDNVGDVRRPSGDPLGVVVVLHGGLWRQEYERDITETLAVDLIGRGWITWNIEYRRGAVRWPGCAHDVLTAIDHVRRSEGAGLPLAVIGHSAGGHLALWAAARRQGAIDLLIGLAPITDLAEMAGSETAGSAEARSLLDAGAPASVPALPERTLLVHGEDDDLVPATHSTRLSTEATVEIVPGMGHFPMLDPGREHWPLVVAELGKTRSPVASELPPLSTDR
jgi:3-dehydroquinate dehydratase/alpha-beta hydrolase superfamily lysophospholipase